MENEIPNVKVGTPSIKDLRFIEMDKVGELILEELRVFEEKLNRFIVFETDPIGDYCLSFVREKLGDELLQKKLENEPSQEKPKKSPLRGYFSWKLFKYLGHYGYGKEAVASFSNAESLLEKKLPFVFEMVICIQYIHNHMLDEKFNANPAYHAKLCSNLISSNILREVLHLYLEEEVKPLLNSSEQYVMISDAVRKLLFYVDLGQRVDKSFNHYQNWKNGVAAIDSKSRLFDALLEKAIRPAIDKVKADVPSKQSFIDGYFHRIYLSNVYFFRCMVEVVAPLMQTPEDERDNLLLFSIQFGYMLQIINDYADFAYSEDKKEQELLKASGKSSKDYFSDLYNFNITLPLIYHLNENGKRLIESYLEGGQKRKKNLTQYPLQIKQEIVDSGAIRACINLTRELSKHASSRLEDTDNPATAYFKEMCDMALFNKYYKIFK